jgi:hypothetical protein
MLAAGFWVTFDRILVVFWPNFPIKDKGTNAENVLFLYFTLLKFEEGIGKLGFSCNFALILFIKFLVSFWIKLFYNYKGPEFFLRPENLDRSWQQGFRLYY